MPYLIVALSLIAIIILGSFIIYLFVFYSPKSKRNNIYNLPTGEQYLPHHERMRKGIEEFNSLPYERVSVKSFDGLSLSAKYYHQKDNVPVIIAFHGYRATAIRDFSGGQKLWFSNGLNALVVDQRAMGNSEGNTITFGIKERRDCLSWINYCIDRFGKDVKIMLTGISMGASTILMANDLNLPKNVKGIIADCPFSSPKQIICKVCEDMKMPSKFFYPSIYLGARIFGGFNLNEQSAMGGVKQAKVPILLIHGSDDRLVPHYMSKQLYDCNPTIVQFHTFEGAGHGISYFADKNRYDKIASDFIQECIRGDL